MTDQAQPTYTLEEARAELARQECRQDGHDYDHIEVVKPLVGEVEPAGVRCRRCGRSWPIATAPPSPPALEEEVVGYLVVDTRRPSDERGQWVSPRPRHTPAEARRDRDFWREAAPDRVLRLAKVVLLLDQAPV